MRRDDLSMASGGNRCSVSLWSKWFFSQLMDEGTGAIDDSLRFNLSRDPP